jgi:hypothetical protein
MGRTVVDTVQTVCTYWSGIGVDACDPGRMGAMRGCSDASERGN